LNDPRASYLMCTEIDTQYLSGRTYLLGKMESGNPLPCSHI